MNEFQFALFTYLDNVHVIVAVTMTRNTLYTSREMDCFGGDLGRRGLVLRANAMVNSSQFATDHTEGQKPTTGGFLLLDT